MAITDKMNILERLAEGITQLTNSERWQEWLNMQSRFHHYSFNNTLLIMMQRPDATQVAGFNAWRQARSLRPQGREGHLDLGADGVQDQHWRGRRLR